MAFPKVGNMAPAFTLVNQNGDKVSLKDYKGKKKCCALFLPQSHDAGLYHPGLWYPGCQKGVCQTGHGGAGGESGSGEKAAELYGEEGVEF